MTLASIGFLLLVALLVIGLARLVVGYAEGATWRGCLFGWICMARGYHRSYGKPEFHGGANGDYVVAVLAGRCRCGATKLRNADILRGGRVPYPFTWPVEEKPTGGAIA